MDAAKGAAIGLLAEAYKNRNKICLINFHGKGAEVLVPPTKSIAMTKSRLQSMPCGGGSPLAHAIEIALRTGVNSMKIKKDVGRCILVLITDGRANIPLCISHGDEFDPATYPSFQGMPTKQFLHDEVISCAKRLGAIKSFNILIIDTEDKFVSTGLAKVSILLLLIQPNR
jgi:magnesium chelatase subunit D